jgi:hypothetical protein
MSTADFHDIPLIAVRENTRPTDWRQTPAPTALAWSVAGGNAHSFGGRICTTFPSAASISSRVAVLITLSVLQPVNPKMPRQRYSRIEEAANWNQCAEDNHHVTIGKDDYFISAGGLLMPVKKDQPPPDLRYFRQSKK